MKARSCTRDEGGPFGAGSQVQASNHSKLLSSKATVVSVAVNVGRISRRVRLREASASEPGSVRENPEACPNGIRHVGGAKLSHREDQSTDAEHRGEASRS